MPERRVRCADQTTEPTPCDGAAQRTLRWVAILVALGLAWRLLRYALCFPFWGDEAYLNLSILHRGYHELLAPLEYAQIAPLLFLWIQRTAYNLFGGGEYALRALPLLAGVAALLIFARLAWRELEPRAATLATAIFASAYFLVRHTCESKPYASDLLAATILMSVGARWIHDRGDRRAALPATLAVLPLIWLSYPAIFVAGGISLAILVANLRAPVRRAWLGWAIFNAALIGSFLTFFFLFAAPHANRAAGSWLEQYWQDAYPPLYNPLALVWWLVKIHTGRMLAYPVGGPNFGSTLTTLVCLAGAIALVRERRANQLLLWLAPALPTLLAAALHRYPYGDSVRVSIHLAPSICLLAGVGAAALIDLLRSVRARDLAAGVALLILAGIPVGGMIRDLAQPYKAEEEERARQAVADFERGVHTDEPVSIYNAPEGTNAPPDGPTFYQTLYYYIELYTGRSPRWRVVDGLDHEVVWLLVYRGPHFGPTDERVKAVARDAGLVAGLDREYRLSRRAPTSLAVYRCAPLP